MLQNIDAGLICEAQLGNKASIDRLSELVRDRLYPYIYRLTLDETVSQDILQETILFMLQSINRLENAERFWNWLYRTALGKVQHHYREIQRTRKIELSEAERLRIRNRVSTDLNDGLTELLRKELSDAVFKAMKRLKLDYRNVLILRCFDNLEYAEIASVMNCTELRTRVLLFRAKNSLKRQLAVQGFDKRYLLIAMALFGLVTTSAKAATVTTITASSMDVGFTAMLTAGLLSKIGIATVAGIATLGVALPVDTFLYVLGFLGLIAFIGFLVALFGIYN